MAAGRITIYKKKFTKEAGRKKETEPEKYYTCWCDIGELYGQELYDALNAKLENTIIFEVRSCKKIELLRTHLKEYFVVYEGERYEIYATNFRKNDKTKVQLKANRID